MLHVLAAIIRSPPCFTFLLLALAWLGCAFLLHLPSFFITKIHNRQIPTILPTTILHSKKTCPGACSITSITKHSKYCKAIIEPPPRPGIILSSRYLAKSCALLLTSNRNYASGQSRIRSRYRRAHDIRIRTVIEVLCRSDPNPENTSPSMCIGAISCCAKECTQRSSIGPDRLVILHRPQYWPCQHNPATFQNLRHTLRNRRFDRVRAALTNDKPTSILPRVPRVCRKDTCLLRLVPIDDMNMMQYVLKYFQCIWGRKRMHPDLF